MKQASDTILIRDDGPDALYWTQGKLVVLIGTHELSSQGQEAYEVWQFYGGKVEGDEPPVGSWKGE
jgi:hypothetical protein